jgi:hypothetical protein
MNNVLKIYLYTSVAPQLSMSILTTQQTETTGSPFMNTSRGLLMLIGISSGTGLVLINILLIACCLHKRHKKNLKGGKEFVSVARVHHWIIDISLG